MDRKDWPQEIRTHVYANFRNIDPVTAAKARKPQWRAHRPGNDPKYLDALRSLGCLLGCTDPGVSVQAHHLKSGEAGKQRGVMLRATDQFAVPLCFHHHNEIERLSSAREATFFASRGVSVHLYAKQSWRAWETHRDVGRLEALFVAHQREAIRKLGEQHRTMVSARGTSGSRSSQDGSLRRGGRAR